MGSGPLAGLRIIDMTSVIMGPYATQILADYGADVIHVEPPDGDVLRNSGPMREPNMAACAPRRCGGLRCALPTCKR
jgi:crotonobetainyl-CoA:carnitine CoA-transferase CaiB-like acyl-CoA transferase